MYNISEDELEFFKENGYLIVNNFIESSFAKKVAERFELIFRGNFETTVPPDEWRWAYGRDPDNVTRMIWNGWKSDRTIASLALNEKVGYYAAKLAGWSGARLNQDGCLWKPPGSSGLAYHQDIQYIQWVVPHDMITCWVALDDTDYDSGTLEYVAGSHKWPLMEKRPLDFHNPDDYQSLVKQIANELGEKLEIVTVEVPRGGAAFHNSRLWHGSGKNIGKTDRRALAIHCMQDIAEFHPKNPAFAQGRFKKFGETIMEESFYPILWSKKYNRSAFIEEYLKASRINYTSHTFKKNIS